MANKYVKKVATGANDVSGQKSSRYEKMQVTYGVVAAADYALGDVLVFNDVPSLDIIKATIVAHSDSPVTLEVFPGTDVSTALPLAVTSPKPKISYVIEYIRGTGAVGTTGAPGELLQISLGVS